MGRTDEEDVLYAKATRNVCRLSKKESREMGAEKQGESRGY